MEKKWNDFAKRHLLGKTIVSVRYMTQKEAENMGWHSRPVAMFFSDGSYVFPSMDDEGNDGGALFGTSKDGEDLCFPVI